MWESSGSGKGGGAMGGGGGGGVPRCHSIDTLPSLFMFIHHN